MNLITSSGINWEDSGFSTSPKINLSLSHSTSLSLSRLLSSTFSLSVFNGESSGSPFYWPFDKSLCLSVSLSVSLCLSVCLPLSLFLSLCVSPSVSLSVCLSVISVSLSLCLSVCLSLSPPLFLSVYLPPMILVYVPEGVNVEAAMAGQKVLHYRRLILNLTVRLTLVGPYTVCSRSLGHFYTVNSDLK